MFAVELSRPMFSPEMFNLSDEERRRMRAVLSEVGRKVVEYLRSLTSEMRPPAYSGGPERAAHPGHWADVTGELARGYEWRVEDTTMGVQLVLSNDVGYAMYLEAHEGFFVLSGVADDGGPVSKAMADVVPKIAPGWEVRNA